MIFAAGKGTRLKPLTDTVPKAMLPVAGKPLIQHVLENVATKPGNLVVVNVHHHAPQIVNFIDITRQHWKAEIRISHEDTLLETGGGLKKAAPLFMNGDHTDTQPILIHNVDIISNVCLPTFYNSHRDTDDASADDEDIYLDEFKDEIEEWVVEALKKAGFVTAKSVLNAPRDMLVEKADLEEETVDNVLEILRAEFED